MNDNIKKEDPEMKIIDKDGNRYTVEADRKDWETLKEMLKKVDEEDMKLLFLDYHTILHYQDVVIFETFYLSENINPLNIYIAAKRLPTEKLVEIYILEETFSMLDSLISPVDIADPYPATEEEVEVIHKLAEAWIHRPDTIR